MAGPTQTGTPRANFYAYLQWLSVDVAAGALAGGCMAQGVCGVAVHGSWYVVLPMAVWVVYTLDHLLDARRLGARASTPRHRFHHVHFTTIAAVAAGVGVLTFGLAVWGMGLPGLAFGACMAALTGGHLLLVRWAGSRVAPWLLKELGVALVYVLGIWGWPLWLSHDRLTPALLLPVVQYLALALANLLTFSWFERESDAADGQTSFVLAIGSRAAQGTIVALVAIALGCMLVLTGMEGSDMIAQAVIVVMALLTLVMLLRPRWMAQRERYRWFGDGVFLFPYLYLLFDQQPEAVGWIMGLAQTLLS